MSGKPLPLTVFGFSFRIWCERDVTDSTVHLHKEGFLPPCNLHLGGGRLKGGTRGRQVVWVCGYVAWLLDRFVLTCTDAQMLFDMCKKSVE